MTIFSPLKPRLITALALTLVAVLSACTMIGQQEYPLSDHSDGNRFYNRDGSDKGLADISRFLWESLWSEAEWPESVANPAATAIPDRV
ncbi:Zn-dependent hydrolase, partial [Luminiphilus sp.]|nr:Zn-dependent hydrolase [Luminiphilus sp.]